MVEEQKPPNSDNEDAILQRQYLRALSSFEGIVLSQIDVKNKLGNRLNYSIRTGIVILGAIAFSILVLLFTLTTQIDKVSDVVKNMNNHFNLVAGNMEEIRRHMDSMEHQVSLIEGINQYIEVMDQEMNTIESDIQAMQANVGGIRTNLAGIRDRVGNIALSVDKMNLEMQAMSHEMHRMGKPARSMNKMFPFP